MCVIERVCGVILNLYAVYICMNPKTMKMCSLILLGIHFVGSWIGSVFLCVFSHFVSLWIINLTNLLQSIFVIIGLYPEPYAYES